MKIGNKQIGFQICALLILISSSVTMAQPLKDKTLTESGFKDWMKTRIETHKLQLEFKANASQYDDLPLAYFTARNEWLESEGKDPNEWDQYSEWIHAIYSSVEEKRDIEEQKSRFKAEIEEIDNNEFLNAEQKQMMKSGLTQVLDKREDMLEPYKDDWPVAEKYESTFVELMYWTTGNVPNPPEID